MVKGIHASAGAMRHAMAAQSILANNLANAQTAGFKQDRIGFRLSSVQGPVRVNGLGADTSMVDCWPSDSVTRQGTWPDGTA